MEEEDDGYAEYDKSLETLGRVRAVCAVKSCHNPQGISQNTLILYHRRSNYDHFKKQLIRT